MRSLTALSPQMLSLLRIVAALIFMAHGSQKILGVPAGSMAVGKYG